MTVEKELQSGKISITDVRFEPIVTHYGDYFRDITTVSYTHLEKILVTNLGVRFMKTGKKILAFLLAVSCLLYTSICCSM